jgi:hypothetical protein
MDNNSNHDKPPRRRPDVSLGTMTFTLDLYTGAFNIGLSKDNTGQLTTPEEATGLFSMTACKLFCEELQRRSKRIIVT